jgi:hypothetical protein
VRAIKSVEFNELSIISLIICGRRPQAGGRLLRLLLPVLCHRHHNGGKGKLSKVEVRSE